ncbi:MAG: hypothetical protein U7127_19335 [Phormidium sp.]
MKEKGFWHRLIVVLTLTVFLVTIQFPILPNQAWAETGTIINCNPDKMSHADCNIDNRNIDNRKTEHKTVVIINNDSGKAEAFVGGVIVGAIGGSATTIATVSGAGSVAGLSAAGVTSGLAAIGSITGGGMVAGLAVSAALPVVAAAGVGYLAYKGWEWFHPSQQSQEISY